MRIQTEGELFAQLIEHLRKSQELSATLAHLAGENRREATKRGWLKVSENFKLIQHVVTQVATGKLN